MRLDVGARLDRVEQAIGALRVGGVEVVVLAPARAAERSFGALVEQQLVDQDRFALGCFISRSRRPSLARGEGPCVCPVPRGGEESLLSSKTPANEDTSRLFCRTA